MGCEHLMKPGRPTPCTLHVARFTAPLQDIASPNIPCAPHPQIHGSPYLSAGLPLERLEESVESVLSLWLRAHILEFRNKNTPYFNFHICLRPRELTPGVCKITY